MSVETMRVFISRAYPNETWAYRVYNEFSDDQVIAIYNRFVQDGIIEGGLVKNSPEWKAPTGVDRMVELPDDFPFPVKEEGTDEAVQLSMFDLLEE